MKKKKIIKLIAIFILGLLIAAIGTVSAGTREECKKLEEEFCDTCGKQWREAIDKICSPHWSYGCAHWTVSCSRGFPQAQGGPWEFVYRSSFCYNDNTHRAYVSCMKPVVKKYQQCLVDCNNRAYKASKAGEPCSPILKACSGHDWENKPDSCYRKFMESYIDCKFKVCDELCKECGRGGSVPREKLGKSGDCRCLLTTPNPWVKFDDKNFKFAQGETMEIGFAVINKGEADIKRYRLGYRIVSDTLQETEIFKTIHRKEREMIGTKEQRVGCTWKIPDNTKPGFYYLKVRVIWWPTSDVKSMQVTSEYPQLFEVTKSSAPVPRPPASPSESLCDESCKKILGDAKFGDAKNMEILESSGTYPNCRCQADYFDEDWRRIKTVNVHGNKKTTYRYDPETGELIGKPEVTTISEEGEGIIDRALEFGSHERDENRCSPVEYAYQSKNSAGKTITLCRCKPGYKRVAEGCMFDKPKNTKLSNDELKKLEYTLRQLDTNKQDTNKQNTIQVMKDGKLVKLGVLRRADQSLVYTLDGKTWDGELKNLLNPDIWYKAGRAIGNFFDTIINIFSQASYGDKDKQMRYEAVDDALKVYKKSIQKPKHFNQYVYEYYKSAEDTDEAIKTLYQAGILKGSAELATGALKSWAIQFPAEVVKKSMNTAKTQVLANGFFVYARERDAGMSPQKVMKDDNVQQRIENLRGQPAFIGPMGEVILGQLYEEAYQRYLLRKKL